VVGLVRYVSARYLGGTLLGIIALGALMHPAVGRAFSALPRQRAGRQLAGPGADDLAENPADLVGRQPIG
jgi:hypothetical protein